MVSPVRQGEFSLYCDTPTSPNHCDFSCPFSPVLCPRKIAVGHEGDGRSRCYRQGR
jgi:hypothetical protein